MDYEGIYNDVMGWVRRRMPLTGKHNALGEIIEYAVKQTLNRVSDEVGDFSPFTDGGMHLEI